MGYFDFLRALDAEAEQLTAEAEAAAAAVHDAASLIAAARPRLENPRFVDTLYQRAAARIPAVKLVTMRVSSAIGRDAEASRALMESGWALAAPYLLSRLFTDQKDNAARVLAQAYPQFQTPYGDVLAPFAQSEGVVGFFTLLALNTSPFPDEQIQGAALFEQSALPDPWKDALRTRAANAGIDRFDDWLVAQLEATAKRAETRAEDAISAGKRQHTRREENSPIAGLCTAAGKRKLSAAVPALCTLLNTFDALEALDALGAIGDRSALPAVRAYRAMLAGKRRATLPYRLAADNALSRLDDPQPVDSAWEVFRTYYPRRYGYPKSTHLVDHWRRALEALMERGTADDQAFVARWVAAPWAAIRDVAAKAWSTLHDTPPSVDFWDRPRIALTAANDGHAELMTALPRVTTAFRHRVFEHLMEHGTSDERGAAARWLRETLEAQPNLYAETRSELSEDLQIMVKALKARMDVPAVAAAVDGTTSAWLQCFVLDGGKMEKPPYYESIDFAGTLNAEGTLPFKYGQHINGLAVSPDGTRLAVVGQNYGRIDRLPAGEIDVWLELRWNWGYDCAFSPDGSMLAVCFHGGHVEIFDAVTGKRIGDELKGHGGVPDGVRRLAFSPDGATLITVGQDARVIAWDVARQTQRWRHFAARGSFEAVTFTPDGTQVIASHVKTTGGEENFLVVLDAATGEATTHPMPSSMWALCFTPDGTQLAMGGEAKTAAICDPATFEVRRTLDLGKTVRLVNSPDGRWLYGVSEAGSMVRWAYGDAKAAAEVLADETGPLWALTAAPDGTMHAIGTRGELLSMTAEGPVDRPVQYAHGKQLKRFLPDADGLLTGSWDGQVLRWRDGRAELIFKSARRINDLARHPDGRLLVAHGRGLTVVAPDGTSTTLAEGDFEAVAVSADGRTIAAADDNPLRLMADGDETTVVVGTDDIRCILPTDSGGWLIGTEAGEVTLVKGGERRWTVADHGFDRMEFGSPHKDICDMTLLSDGFVSAGNDNIVRVYRWTDDSPQVRLRIHTDCGIFNRISASPDGRLLALPSSGALRVVDLQDGRTLALLTTLDHFGQNALTAACFLDDDICLLGTETGRFFRLNLGGLR
jgi:WD40 repeat protein